MTLDRKFGALFCGNSFSWISFSNFTILRPIGFGDLFYVLLLTLSIEFNNCITTANIGIGVMKKILIDNSFMRYALASNGCFESHEVLWGGECKIKVGNTVSIEKPEAIIKSIGSQIGAIARLAETFITTDKLRAYRSDALEFELIYQNPEIHKEIRLGDVSLMKEVQYEKLRTFDDFSVTISGENFVEDFRTYLRASSNPEYTKIRDSLQGEKKYQDAWHLFCIQKYNLDAFLTMDMKLVGQIKSISDKKLRNELLYIVKNPTQLCEEIGVSPMTDEEINAFVKRTKNPYR